MPCTRSTASEQVTLDISSDYGREGAGEFEARACWCEA
jgi:hypothetical protein